VIKFYLLYTRTILKTNLLLSFAFTLVAALISVAVPNKNFELKYVTTFFTQSMMTGGFLLAILYYNFSRKNEYYFYYNAGIGRVNLIVGAYLFHLILAVPLLIIIFHA
jgi:predicted small secreted protein